MQLLEAQAGENNGHLHAIQRSDTLRMEIARDATGRPSSLQLSLLRGGQLMLQFNSAHFSAVRIDDREQDTQRKARIREQVEAHPELDKPLPRAAPLEWPQPPAPPPSYIGWQLRDLSRRISTPIIADCYPAAEAEMSILQGRQVPWPSPENDGLRLVSVLEDLTLPLDYDWRLKDGWLELRYQLWFWVPLRPVAAKPSAK